METEQIENHGSLVELYYVVSRVQSSDASTSRARHPDFLFRDIIMSYLWHSLSLPVIFNLDRGVRPGLPLLRLPCSSFLQQDFNELSTQDSVFVFDLIDHLEIDRALQELSQLVLDQITETSVLGLSSIRVVVATSE